MRLERITRYRRRVDVHEPEPRVVRHQMITAVFAPLADAVLRLAVRADSLGSARDRDRARRPQRECVHRACRPLAARGAMAIAHTSGLTRDAKLDGPAETSPHVTLLVRHWFISSSRNMNP